MKNRTHEFQQCVESISQSEGQILLPVSTSRSQFAHASSLIQKKINGLVGELQNLTQLANNKSLFHDNNTAINDLIQQIKQELAIIKNQIQKLQQHIPKTGTQSQQHSSGVVDSLNTRLSMKSTEFGELLKTRKQNLKEQQKRKSQFIENSYTPPSTFSAQEHVVDFGYAAQEYADQNDAYLRDRDETITSIEQTISELGQVYSQFATALAQQRENIQRIDDNTIATLDNVQGAHNQLLKYYENMTQNRGLMFKSFGVVITFFLMFVLVS